MNRKIILPEELALEPMGMLKETMLLTAGNMEHYNGMTVSFGFLGTYWFRPCALLTVRPSRYTWSLLEQGAEFTLSAFPKQYAETLIMLGKQSGRDTDKMEQSGLTAVKSEVVLPPSFEQAKLTLECRLLYEDEMRPDKIRNHEMLSDLFPNGDFHKLVLGEILCAWEKE